MKRTLFIALLAAVALAALAACNNGDGDGETPATGGETPAAGETPEPTTPAADGDEFSLPESGVAAPLSSPYAYELDTNASLTAEPEKYPFPAGSVSARWYQSEGLYVVYFDGFPLDGGLCPGASIQLASGGFQNAANSPTAPGACEGTTSLRPPPTGPYICPGDLVLFLTEVPTSTDGVLFASTNLNHGDGTATGLLGSTPANLDETPEVDLSPCEPPTG
jgi:predicted small secreted protein